MAILGRKAIFEAKNGVFTPGGLTGEDGLGHSGRGTTQARKGKGWELVPVGDAIFFPLPERSRLRRRPSAIG